MTRRRRGWLIALCVIAAFPLAGVLYQSWCVWRDSLRFPPQGQMVAVVGPRRINLVCIGAGSPTVIFEPGGFGGALSASVAREEVSKYTRVCSYSRVGMGWSDPVSGAISVGMLADDLERLIAAASLEPPFIIVPASFGGLTAETFARRHPNQVAGMVFLDAANSEIIDRFGAEIAKEHLGWACLLPMVARLGILRAADPFGLRTQPGGAEAMAFLYRAEPMSTFCGIARGVQETLREFATAPPLSPDIPLTVLVHERPDELLPPGMAAETAMLERDWFRLQQRFAQRSRRGTSRVVPGSDHLLFSRKPQEVASAVIEMLGRK